MSVRGRAAVRTAGGAVIFAFVLWWLGAGPFLEGLRALDAGSVLTAATIGLLTTVAAAWRWAVVAERLGVRLPMRSAVGAYYRSQFVNVTLPGGILGDVHRAVNHGRRCRDLGRGVRGVVWERTAGQVVQLGLTVAVLVAVPSPVQSALPVVCAVFGAATIVVLGCLLVTPRARTRGGAAWRRLIDSAGTDVRTCLLARDSWPRIAAASAVVVVGHTGVFVLATHLVAPAVPLLRALPLAVLVLLASTVPLHVAGWGPREGAAAWVFATAGLGASAGVSVATTYGVLVILSCLPGGVIVLLSGRRLFARVGPGTTVRGLPGDTWIRQDVSHG